MTQLQPQNLVEQLNNLEAHTTKLQTTILLKKQELENLGLSKEIKELELKLKETEKEATELKEIWKEILINAWMKKFEALDGTIIQLNKKPWSLIIENESLVPQEYKKEKITISIDKKQLKEDITQGLIIEWVSISEDYNLVIKNPK